MAKRTEDAWPPAPEPLPVATVDNHTHLEMDPWIPEARASVAEQISRAAAVGVDRMLTVGCDPAAAAWTAEVVADYDALVGGIAIHPNEAARIARKKGMAALDAAIEGIADLARVTPRIRAITETGLDYYRTKDEAGHKAQHHSFRAHIALAKELDLPMQIHAREATEDVLATLAADGAPERTIFHCFSGDAELAREVTAKGWYVSFAGPITFRNAHEARAAVAAAPFSQVLVETDAPYLAPQPHRGRPNAPYLMPHTVRVIAKVVGRPLADVCQQISETSEELYGPWF